jgi:hypothetical protein
MGASEAGREAGHLGPDLKGLGPGLAMSGGIGVGRTAEEVCHLVMNREKALGLAGGLEALHDALASSGRLMAVLRTIVQASVLSMLDTRHDLSLGCTVAGQLVRDHHARCSVLLLKKLAQQPLGGLGSAAALNQDIKHESMLIDSSPEPMLPACNANDNFVEVPLVSGAGRRLRILFAKPWPNFIAHCRTVS